MEAKRTSLIMIIMVICTVTIIGTNYIFTKGLVTDINETLLENEYKKIGGKENYLILQEIQKREILSYLNTLKTQQPGLVKEILDNQNQIEKTNYKILDKSIIDDLKNDSYIMGNSGALITMVEFSDLECPFCIEQHEKYIFNEAMKNNPENVNYIFKNFPLPSHKNSQKEAEAAKCIESITGGKKYFEYIDAIFSDTKGGGEGYNQEGLVPLAEKLNVDKSSFENCLNNGEITEKVEREFIQGRMLGIQSVPSTMIINNKTGEYEIISEVIDYDNLENIINDISK